MVLLDALYGDYGHVGEKDAWCFRFPFLRNCTKIESGGTEISFDLIEYGGKDGAMISKN